MLGGFKWKAWRRFVLPVVLFYVCSLYPVSLIQGILVAILCMIVTSLPYGENSSWTVRIGTAISYGLIGIPLGFDWLMLLVPAVTILMLALSKWGVIQHKIAEGVIGFSIALPIANMLYKL